MQVKPYEKAIHAQLIDSWLKARDFPEISSQFAQIGVVVYSDEGEPVSAGFLRKVEGSYCLFDGLISNPSLHPFKRHAGLNIVIKTLSAKAKELGMKSILAFSVDEGTLKRSFRLGFKLLPDRVIVLNL